MQLISVPGGDLATWRLGSGPPALVLHGGPGLSDYTEGLTAELAPMFDTIRYQQRGLPPTTLREPYTIESHMGDAISLLDALRIERGWVIGHSWGGHLAMHLAVAHPERLLGLIVIDPLGAVGDGGEQEMGRQMNERTPAASRQRAEELDQRAMRGEGTEEDAVESLRLYWPAYFAEPGKAPPMPPIAASVPAYAETFNSIHEHFAKQTLLRGLPAYQGISLFLHGSEDPIPYECCKESAALVSGAVFSILDGCGHFPWMEKRGLIAQSVHQLRRF